MDCGDAGREPAFSTEKTRSRSQKGKNREWGELWTCSFFSKNYIEVWLILSFALSSAAQQCDSVIHIKNIFSYSFSCDLSLNVEYSFLCSTVGLCCFSFLCFWTTTPPLPYILPHGNLMFWPFLVVDELSYPLLRRKSIDTYQKRDIKQRIVLGLDICGSRR